MKNTHKYVVVVTISDEGMWINDCWLATMSCSGLGF